MTPRNGNNVEMLAILAAMGASMGDGFGPPPMRAPRSRLKPQPVDHEAECRKFHGKVLVHRVNGDRRRVAAYSDEVAFFDFRTSRVFVRSFRKALDWIRNADVVGEA